MHAIRRFYAEPGRTSRASLTLIAIIVAAILYAVPFVDWTWGLAPNFGIGMVGGAAFGTFVVASIRRMRDAAISLRLAGWVTLGILATFVVALLTMARSDAPWANVVLDMLVYVVPGLWLAIAVWPRHPVDDPLPTGRYRAGYGILLAFMILGAGIVGFIAWVSTGMHEANERRMEYEQLREREDGGRGDNSF
ncbi:hypothetical protein [uncultured Sphingomonas sp.]|uniref:hypothetical protein n=1 Tax=uncultured Sphingomonas sp. TaxID=158754 RepID=UPI0025D9F93D|nr:hypothetical protein [uncultured Sphingomonas sp.]